MSRAHLIKKGLVYTNTQAWYKKVYKGYVGREYVELANRILPFIQSKLNISEKTKVVISCIKAKRTKGSFYYMENMAVIDPRQPYNSFINSLVHELVHAQQYYLGQLKAVVDKDHGIVFHWKDENFGKHPTSHTKYLALPWEVEARKIADQMTKEIITMLKNESGKNV